MTRTTKLMLGIFIWAAVASQAYVPMKTSTGLEVKWGNVSSSPVSYLINSEGIGDTTFTTALTQAIDESFGVWASVVTSRIDYENAGRTETAGGRSDGRNVIDFSNDNEIFSGAYAYTEVIGLTILSYNELNGEILDADIVFNTADYTFSTTQETNLSTTISATGSISISGYVNFNNIAVHEIGHFSGLGHSYIDGNVESIKYDSLGSFLGPYPDLGKSATMFPYELNGSESRSLQLDDEAGISHLYPYPTFYSTMGIISGQIVNANDVQEPVFGAHVVAVDSVGRQESVAALSDKDGYFTIDGLEPGNYYIYAEPISFPETAESYYAQAELDFPQEFYDDQFSIETASAITVTANSILPIDGMEHTVLVGFSAVDQNEPNDSFLEFTEANPDIVVPGVIGESGDVDFFRFRALRGSLIHVEVVAQQLNTLMEPVLTIYDADENVRAQTSDTFGYDGDAALDFRVPKSGFYFVKVEHSNDREGGEGYYYQLEITASEEVIPVIAGSGPLSVLSFELASDMVLPEGDSRQLRLKEINLVLEDVGPPYGDFTKEDIDEITNTSSSGVSVYSDVGGYTTGEFDYRPSSSSGNDKRLPIDSPLASSVTITQGLGQIGVRIRFADVSQAILPFIQDGYADFHVVINTSSKLHLGDDFKVYIPANGLKLSDVDSNIVSAFSSPLPTNPPIFTGELLSLTSMTTSDQRIARNSNPTAVLAVDAVGDPDEEYYISEITFQIIGYSAKNFVPFLIDSYRSYPVPDTIVREIGSYGDFNMDDLQQIYPQGNDGLLGGGIALYRDWAAATPDGGYEGDGTFEAGIDRVVPFDQKSYKEIPIEKIPLEYLDALVPRFLGQDIFSTYASAGFNFATDLNVRAFEVTLKLRDSSLTKLPVNNLARDANEGADFFVAVQTSDRTTALDCFMVIIPDEAVRIKNNYGVGEDPTINRPSLAYLDPTVPGEAVEPLTVRPRPAVDITDYTKEKASSRTLPLDGGLVPVMGLNMQDFGMTTHLVPQSSSVAEPGIYFNQGYIWDYMQLRFIPRVNFERTDLRAITQRTDFSNNQVEMSHGVAIYLDDDTPIGDFLDNDGDGLIDEELLNGRDDDLDGVIDEEDWGDEDDAGESGVFDERDRDNFWPTLNYTRGRGVDFTSEAGYAAAPDFPNVLAADGVYAASFTMEAVRYNEEALAVTEYINDPWTFSPQEIFIRTGCSPVWYPENPELDPDAGSFPTYNWATPQGYYMTLGRDEVDYQILLDTQDDPDNWETTYHHLFWIPDNDTGALAGDDVFIVLRASGLADAGDSFQLQILQDALGFSVYQSPAYGLNVDEEDGTRNFESTLPRNSVTSNEITIGGVGRPPVPEIISPSLGKNYFDDEFSFEVVFRVTDEDSASGNVNVYLDNNNLSYDGIQLNSSPLPLSQTRFTFSLKDPAIFKEVSKTFLIGDIQRMTEQDHFYVYIEATDLVNDAVRVYSEGYITVNQETIEDLAQYIKLNRDGEIQSVGVSNNFADIPVNSVTGTVDLEVLPDENGVLVLRADGRVYGRTNSGTELGKYEPYRKSSFDPEEDGRVVMDGDLYFPNEVAVDLELVPDNPGYYVLDSFGGVHAVGNVIDFSSGLYGDIVYFGWSIVRDMELNKTGDGLYILDGMGAVHPIGNVTEFSEDAYWGFDAATDLTLTSSGNGYHILSRYGEIVAQGDAIELAIPDIVPSTKDLELIGLEFTPGTDGYLVMAASGEVTPVINTRIGSDLFLNGQDKNYVDIEVVGMSADTAWRVIQEYFKAYEDENVDRIAALFADDYLDNHGNDKDEALDSLRQTFEYFMIGTPTENPMQPKLIKIAPSAGEYVLTTDVVVSHRIPSFQTLEVGAYSTVVVPFSQTVQIVELQDGRNDVLSVYDLDNDTGIFNPDDPYRDRKVFEKVFSKTGLEGPYKLFLKYEGPYQNSAYVFYVEDGANYGTLQPSDVRLGTYPADSIYHATESVRYEFTLKRQDNDLFQITQAHLLQVLPAYSEETNPVGFSFPLRGPVADYQLLGEDVEGSYMYGPADFRLAGAGDTNDDDVEGLSIQHSIPSYMGIVNLSEALNVRDFDAFRPEDYEDIRTYQFENAITVEVDSVYLVITKDQKHYGLLKPVRLSTDAALEGSVALVFDWKYDEDEFVIPE